MTDYKILKSLEQVISNELSLLTWVSFARILKNKEVKALAEPPCLKNLTTLDLWNNNIGDEGVKALVESPYMRNYIICC